jgi:hypothetical protein
MKSFDLFVVHINERQEQILIFFYDELTSDEISGNARDNVSSNHKPGIRLDHVPGQFSHIMSNVTGCSYVVSVLFLRSAYLVRLIALFFPEFPSSLVL